ncbi:MAG: DUF2027 domain-containing protein [Bacteroidales bacterium]
MQYKIGDKVKFLDQKGGGTVCKIINSTTVHVMIEDGFEIPCLIHDIIKVEVPKTYAEKIFNQGPSVNEVPFESKKLSATNSLVEEDLNMVDESENAENTEYDRISPLHKGHVKAPQVEGVYLAYVPHDQQWLLTGLIDIYLINYTPYEILYTYAVKGNDLLYGVDFGNIPAQSKILVQTIERDEFNQWEQGIIQILFHIEERKTCIQPISSEYRVRANKYMQTESYIYPVFLREKALLLSICKLSEHEQNTSVTHLSEKEDFTFKSSIAKSEKENSPIVKHLVSKDLAEVDLHIGELVDDYYLLSPKEMLDIQLSYFTKCLEDAIMHKIHKVIFIHGVGSGTLKRELQLILKNYDDIHCFDASMAKYGVGAIEVFIGNKN